VLVMQWERVEGVNVGSHVGDAVGGGKRMKIANQMLVMQWERLKDKNVGSHVGDADGRELKE